MMMNHDSKIWALRKICESELEYKRLEGIIVTNLSLFTDTYHYLQSQSKTYPFISFEVARKKFFIPGLMNQGFATQLTVFDTILK